MVSNDMVKHDMEDPKSWDFFQQKLLEEDSSLEDRPHKRRELKRRKIKIPKPGEDTFHAMMIDAGSQGTRIHLYEFEQRILYNKKEIEKALNGMKLSSPTTDSRWTNRLKPGLDSLASIVDDDDLIEAVEEYLKPLFDFTKTVLAGKEESWSQYPIFLKATGGLRTLPTAARIRLINSVRKVFHDTKFNPFEFEDERCRVISGEEEAIYGWAAVNYIKGTLVRASEGIGTVLNPSLTYGMIEMGGASTQIGFFEPNGDLMANLFKLQIGAARHWNVYVHSFLYFGVNGAWDRLNARLHEDDSFGLVNRNDTGFVNPCLPVGSSIPYSSWIHSDPEGHLLPRSSPLSTTYNSIMRNEKADFESCREKTKRLLRKEANLEWVDFSHDGDAGFAGVYQPPLPINETAIGGFVATSNFADTWEFLELNETSPIYKVEEKAKTICQMTVENLENYNKNLQAGAVDDTTLPKMCFRALFVYEMLTTGYGFPREYEITAVDTIDGFKLGWSLGSILYEVNALPWEVARSVKVKANVTAAEGEALEECLAMDDDDDDDDNYEDEEDDSKSCKKETKKSSKKESSLEDEEDDSKSKSSKKETEKSSKKESSLEDEEDDSKSKSSKKDSKSSKKETEKSSKKESSNNGEKEKPPPAPLLNTAYLSQNELSSGRGRSFGDHSMVTLFSAVAFVALLGVFYRRRNRGQGYRPIPTATVQLEC